MRIALLIGILSSILLSGCIASNAPNLVGKRGNYANTGKSFEDIRAARRGIKTYSRIPNDAHSIKEVSVQRCHQNFTEDAPTIPVMEDDLILEAYAQGADGISNIRHDKQSGLMKNCWHIRTATGTSFRLD